ncbi:MAG: hypothetical protein ACFCD0_19680 [Gemmataceae bacterium]
MIPTISMVIALMGICPVPVWSDQNQLPISTPSDERVRSQSITGFRARMAPAPKTFRKDGVVKYPWSKPVKGLRVRVFPMAETFHQNAVLKFRLQFQNVTQKPLRLSMPEVMPMIAPPNNHPYARFHYDCLITAQPVNGAVSITWRARASLSRVRGICTLSPMGILQFDIQCRKMARKEKTKKVAKQGTLLQQEMDARFILRDPGKYKVTGFYEYPRKDNSRGNSPGRNKAVETRINARLERQRVWTGKIVLPSVIVEIKK